MLGEGVVVKGAKPRRETKIGAFQNRSPMGSATEPLPSGVAPAQPT